MIATALAIPAGFIGLLPVLTPFITGLIARVDAPSKIKSGIMISVSALVTLIQGAVVENGAAIISSASLTQWAINAVIATGIYTGIMKPFDVPSKLLPKSGIGA